MTALLEVKDLSVAFRQGGVESRPTHTTSGLAREVRDRLPPAVPVADPPDRHPGRVDADPPKPAQGVGHQTLAAGLVDRGGARLDDRDLQPLAGRVDRGHQADRPAADDEDIDHEGCGGNVASAWFSTRIRVRRSGMFSTVKTSAVTQADPVSGSAKPSTTTAT